MTIKYGASSDARSLEMLFDVPRIYPFKQVAVTLSDAETGTKLYRVKFGKSISIKHQLSPKGGTADLDFEPPFQPKEHGINKDERWLGCLCREFVIVTGKSREILFKKMVTIRPIE